MTTRRALILAAALLLIAVLFATPATSGNVASVIVGAACGAGLALVIRRGRRQSKGRSK